MPPQRPIPEGHTQLGHRIELDPTGPQFRHIVEWCGIARYCYNEALRFQQDHYREHGKRAKDHEVVAHLKRLRDSDKPWLGEAPKEVLDWGVKDLGRAYGNFFKGLEGKGAGQRFPTFKRRGTRDAYYVRNDNLRFNGRLVTLPKLGQVRMKQLPRLPGRVVSARIHLEPTGKVFLCLQVLGPHREDRAAKERARDAQLASQGIPAGKAPTVGIDLGIAREAVTSDGEVITAPRPLKTQQRRLAKAQRVLARRTKGSKRRAKQKRQVAKLNAHIANIRKDHLQKITTRICRENQTICVEDLNIKGMKQLRSLAPALQDIAPAKLLQMLAYKAPLFGSTLVVADRWFPSSKRCSRCGDKKEHLGLDERTYHCESCGLVMDRDLNAALNLQQYPNLASEYPLAGGEVTPGERRALLDRANGQATHLVEPGIDDSSGIPPLSTS